jgi:hypothetical protein
MLRIFRKLILSCWAYQFQAMQSTLSPNLLTRLLTDFRLRNHQPPHPVHKYAKLPQRRIQGGRTGDDAYSQGQLALSDGG